MKQQFLRLQYRDIACQAKTHCNLEFTILKRSDLLGAKAPRAKFRRKIFADKDEKAVNIWQTFSPIFVLHFPGKVGARKFTKNPRQISRATKQILSPRDSGSWGDQRFVRAAHLQNEAAPEKFKIGTKDGMKFA